MLSEGPLHSRDEIPRRDQVAISTIIFLVGGVHYNDVGEGLPSLRNPCRRRRVAEIVETSSADTAYSGSPPY